MSYNMYKNIPEDEFIRMKRLVTEIKRLFVQNQLYEPACEIRGIERNMVTQMEHFDKIDYLNNEIQKQLKNGNIIKQKHNTGDGDSFGEEKPYNNTWG